MDAFGFTQRVKDKHTKARSGIIHTPHGEIETPAFVPVGTQGTVKTLTPDEILELGTQLFFVNTYHMYLRSGLDVITKAGGLHKFIGWNGPIITDSGGFQVFSLGRKKYQRRHSDPDLPAGREGEESSSAQNNAPILIKITDKGVEFQSHWDGTKHTFTPELSMQYQWQLGSDIHLAFDDCTPYPVTHKKAKESMEQTHRWAERSLEEHGRQKSEVRSHKKQYQALYGSIQGSVYEDLRKESAKFITALPFDGFAIGGVAVGESKEEMRNVLDWVCPLLPHDKPRHLLGVGEIDDIFTLVEHGIDTFDCVQATRLGRMGRVYINTTHAKNATHAKNGQGRKFELDITKAEFANDLKPIDMDCHCYTCTHFSRAYLRHLFHVRELLGYRLATIHNVHFINQLAASIRLAIGEGTFLALKQKWLYNG